MRDRRKATIPRITTGSIQPLRCARGIARGDETIGVLGRSLRLLGKKPCFRILCSGFPLLETYLLADSLPEKIGDIMDKSVADSKWIAGGILEARTVKLTS